MSLDTILSISALALCVGQVATARRADRRTIITVGLPLGVAVIIAVSLLRGRIEEENHLQELSAAKREVIAHTKIPATFDDIYSEAYYIPYDLVNEAIDGLVSDERLTSSKVMITDAKGNTHTIRLFSTHP